MTRCRAALLSIGFSALAGCPKPVGPVGPDGEARIITRGGTPTPTPAADPVESARIGKLYQVTVLEAARPWTPDGFAPWLADPDPSVRVAAVTGVGRTAEAFAGAGGDATPFVAALLEKAGDPSADVRGAVAMAIGLSGAAASGKLDAPLAAEANADVKQRWVRAAGRVAPIPVKPPAPKEGEPAPAPPAPSPEVLLLGKALGDPALAASAAWALGVFGLRAERGGSAAFLPDDVIAALKQRFNETASDAREPFAYALWRLHAAGTATELRLGLSDPSPRVRGWCARGLASVPGTHARREVARLLRDSSSDVRVETARAITKLEDKDATAAVELVDLLERSDPPRRKDTGGERLGAQDVHSAVAAAEALGDLGFKATSEPLRSRLASDSSYLFGAAVVAYAKTARAGAVSDLQDAMHERRAPDQWRFRRSIAEALAFAKEKKPETVKTDQATMEEPPKKDEAPAEMAEIMTGPDDVPVAALALLQALLEEEKDARVVAAALDSWGTLMGERATPRMLAVLGSSEDVAMIGTAADKLTSLEKPPAEAGPALIRAFERLMPDDPETAAGLVEPMAKLGGDAAVEPLKKAAVSRTNGLMLAAAKALRAKGITPPQRTEPPLGVPSAAAYLEAADWTRMTIRTRTGEIRLQLYPEIAPITVWQIGTLARLGYFREGSFHRVVPAFVAQGGDPRGDGWGGPDGASASMPCELTDRHYDPGTLGMALSGRDTGGSQFFMALTPQPHLENGYTVFGRVLRGEDVVEQLQIGDEIVDITVP